MRTSDHVADMPPRRRLHETKRRSLKDSMYSYESLYWEEEEEGHLEGWGGTWAGEVASNAWLPHIWPGGWLVGSVYSGSDFVFEGCPGLRVKQNHVKTLQDVTHATLTYGWIGIYLQYFAQ